MLRLLIPFFILLLPLAEIACFILVGRRIGLFSTLSLVVLSAVVGIVLIRIQGFGVLTRLRHIGAHVVECEHDRVGDRLVAAYIDLKRRSLP